MWTWVISHLKHSFLRSWRIYLANTLAAACILLFFAFIDGAARQLQLQQTMFSGEAVVKLRMPVENAAEKLLNKVGQLAKVEEKIRSQASCRFPGEKESLEAQLIGADISKEGKLTGYLSLVSGKLPAAFDEVLIPAELSSGRNLQEGSRISISVTTGARNMTSGLFKISGIYHSPGFSFFQPPRILTSLEAMRIFQQPSTGDIEYCMFFSGEPSAEVNKEIAKALGDVRRNRIESITLTRGGMMDAQNVSVQFNVFLMILVLLTIGVLLTVTFTVNFNIGLILFRRRLREMGTLMAFGVRPSIISLGMILEATLQVLISTIAALLVAAVIALIASRPVSGGFLEFFLVMLSGSNRLDFDFSFWQIRLAFLLTLSAVLLARAPVIAGLFLRAPVWFISRNR